MITQQASFVHITLNPVKVDVHYISNIVSQPTTSMQTFLAVTVTSVTTRSSTSNYTLLPVVGVVGAIVIIAIIVIVIGLICVYFYGIHKRKQMSVNSNCQEMTTLLNQPSILTKYENLPVIASSSTDKQMEMSITNSSYNCRIL